MCRRAWLLMPLMLAACAHAPASGGPNYALAGHSSPGYLFMSGGGPENPQVLGRFVTLAGGRQAPLVLIPFAHGAGPLDNYHAALAALGCTALYTLGGADAQRSSDLQALQNAVGIFLEGGDANLLAKSLAPFSLALRAAWLRGCVIGGDSAGAMLLGRRFISSGERQDVLTRGFAGLTLESGLGLLDSGMVDPHFTERSRFERLYAATNGTHTLGIGIDQQTCATFSPEGTLSCYGVGAVTLMAPTDAGQTRVQVLLSGVDTALGPWLLQPAR